MIKRNGSLCALVLGSLISFGCVAHEGRIKSRFYQPPQTHIIYIHVRGYPVPIVVHIPEMCSFGLEYYEGENRKGGIVFVPKNVFDVGNYGDWFVRVRTENEFRDIKELSDSINFYVGTRLKEKKN